MRRYRATDWDALLHMYLTFEPRGAYQGLPPIREEVVREWLRGLVNNPANGNLVLHLGPAVVGHVAIVHYPTQPGREEIMVFVHQHHRRRGWGRDLLLTAMNEACRHRHCRAVWVTVDWENGCARRLYDALGFRFVGRSELDAEIEMERVLGCTDCVGRECPFFEPPALFADADRQSAAR